MANLKKAAGSKASKKTTKAKASTKSLDEKNKATAVSKAVQKKEMKYIYPDGVTSPLERKAFRQKVRATLKAFQKKIDNFDGTKKDQRALVKEQAAYHASVLA